jgi:hypothetical protein
MTRTRTTPRRATSIRWLRRAAPATLLTALMAAVLVLPGGSVRAQGGLIADGDFEGLETSGALRRHSGGQSWYESRNSSGPKQARQMLRLSTKPVGANATHKAMLKGDPQYNTYLSQNFSASQTGRFSLQWDIYVKEILPPFNRSAFQMIGNATAKGRGPNGSNGERFVFLAFENASTPGRVNLFACEGRDPAQWDRRTIVVPNLALEAWHAVRVDVDVAGKRYFVSVPGVTPQPVEVAAFRTKEQGPPSMLSHVSFATWNDGPGTFYVDNVR